MGMMVLMVIMMVGMMAIGIGVITVIGFLTLAGVSETVKRKRKPDDIAEKPKRGQLWLSDDGELMENIEESELEVDFKRNRGF